MSAFTFKNFAVNKVFAFGHIILSDDDVIKYAKEHDPLPIHIDKSAAKKSLFKGLVASGPQPYSVFHKSHFLPLFADTIMGGLEFKYKFSKAAYANRKLFGKVKITKIRENKRKKYAIVNWRCKITNSKGDVLQIISMKIIHSTV